MMEEKLTGSFEKENGNKIVYEILEHYGKLDDLDKVWVKELNLVSWNEKEPKFDIRRWNTEHNMMGKGITLTKDELGELRKILNTMDLD